MSNLRFYCQELTQGVNTLCTSESNHGVLSLRVKTGTQVVLFDGAGNEAVGIITRANRKAMKVKVDEIIHHPFELSRRMTIAVALPKTHRQGFLIEKCTELGAAAIWPIITTRSVAKPTASSVDKWFRRAIEAAKQSNRSWIPQIKPPCTFDECVGQCSPFDAFSIMDPQPDGQPFYEFLKSGKKDSSILVMIGPEGGWTDHEREQAIRAGAVCTLLSPTVLRSETAAMAACALAATFSMDRS